MLSTQSPLVKQPQQTLNNYDTNHDRDTTHLNIVRRKREPSREIIEGSVWSRTMSYLQATLNSKHPSFGNKTQTSGGTLLKEITDDMNLTFTNDNTPTNTCDSTNDKDILDLIFISPPIILHFRHFWVGEDLGYDHNTIIGIFSHTKIQHLYFIPQ